MNPKIHRLLRPHLLTASVAAATLACATRAEAYIYNWTGGGGDLEWTDGANWSTTNGPAGSFPYGQNADSSTISTGFSTTGTITINFSKFSANPSATDTTFAPANGAALTIQALAGTTGSLPLGGATSFSSSGNVVLGAPGSSAMTVSVGMGKATVNVAAGSTLTINAPVTKLAATINNTAGTLALNGASTFTTALSLPAALTVQVPSINSASANGPLGTGALTLAGKLQVTGAGGSTDRAITLGAAPTIESNGTGANVFTSTANTAFSSTTAPSTLTLGGSAAASLVNVYSQKLVNPGTGANIASLAKTGAATWQLSNANTYTGNTTVSGGTLALGAAGSLAASPTVSVAAGATLDVSSVTSGANFDGTRFALATGQNLTGGGTVTGALDVGSGCALAPGGTGALGTLKTGSLGLLGSAGYNAEINTGTLQSDRLNIAGNFHLDLANTAQPKLADLGGDTPIGTAATFILVDYSGTWDGGTFAGLPNDSTFTFGSNTYEIRYDDVDGQTSAVTLQVIPAPEPSAWLVILGGAGLLALRGRRRVKSHAQTRSR